MQKSQLFIHIRKSHLFKQVELYFCSSSHLWGIQVANKKSYIFIYIYIYIYIYIIYVSITTCIVLCLLFQARLGWITSQWKMSSASAGKFFRNYDLVYN